MRVFKYVCVCGGGGMAGTYSEDSDDINDVGVKSEETSVPVAKMSIQNCYFTYLPVYNPSYC